MNMRGKVLLVLLVMVSAALANDADADSTCSNDAEDCGEGRDEDEEAKLMRTLGPVVDSGPMDEGLNGLDQFDPLLVSRARADFLLPPSEAPYNFTAAAADLSLNGQYGQPQDVAELFRGRWPQDGFFVEAGAYDGEFISHSLLFEIKHKWRGLLVEPNPDAFAALKSKHRKAWISANCLSPDKTPKTVEFDSTLLYGGIVNSDTAARPGDLPELAKLKSGYRPYHVLPGGPFPRRRNRVQCLPLATMLRAAGTNTVHYLVLDVEGAEMPLIESFPWDQIDVKVLQIETASAGQIFPGSMQSIANTLKRAGFVRYKKYAHVDVLFVKKDFLETAQGVNGEDKP